MPNSNWDPIASEVNFNLDLDMRNFLNDVEPNSNILDYGCGYGRLSKELHAHGYKNITGIDSSKEMIKRGLACSPQLTLEHVSGPSIPYLDASFDVVIVCAVFTCITSHADRLSSINELYRVLKPGGILHLVEFCSIASNTFESGIGISMRHSSPKELRLLTKNFESYRENIVQTNTMGGNKAKCYSLFATKSLNKSKQSERF
jgi:ubiquinone/menaquinone biosynthesis C-methylase UbiE